eukprot:TRINITY_DN3223_c0_g2_i1.p1 TRINITY_DN3223_c0_g2~~TRINITY_DN3223_c0_g2_i1.p1  ORF type:complete len:179 (+),score=34.68 TRINITY_DN3223_c0_g2_i1:46-582(+)
MTSTRRWHILNAHLRGLLILLLVLECFSPAVTLEMEWISYSDTADLPMSKQWRDDMKDKLSRVDTSKLPPEKKAKFKQLWARLHGEPSGSSGSPFENATPLLLLLVGIAAVAYSVSQAQQTAPAATGLQTPINPAGGMPVDPAKAEELRQLRMRRFQEASAGGTVLGGGGADSGQKLD